VIGNTLELRATLPQYQAIMMAYLADDAFPPNARVLEVGCGTGAVARFVAQWPQVGDVVRVDPSPVLLDRAHLERGVVHANLSRSRWQSAPLLGRHIRCGHVAYRPDPRAWPGRSAG
jgi:SAM-dependent methyltransferase